MRSKKTSTTTKTGKTARNARRSRPRGLTAFRLRVGSLAIGLLSLTAAPAVAWGPDGHRLAGEIAWLRLNAEARAAVTEILGPGEYSTLAEASVWADAFAREFDRYRWAGPLHYVNVDPWADSYDRVRDCPQGDDCVVEAVNRFRDVVADTGLTRGERREALLFLIHFVQDIHQPLHIAHPDDRGGNRVQVYWFTRERNLHQVWDSGLPERFLDREYSWSWLLGPAWRRHASHLAEQPVPDDWLRAATPEEWANESLQLSREHTYQIVSGMSLGRAYYDETVDVATQRIHMAGVRLAAMLEGLLGESAR